MARVRIAVASTPLAAGVEAAVASAVAAIAAAGQQDAAVVCLPETTIPGHRGQRDPVPDVSAEEMGEAVGAVAAAARRAGVAVIVGVEQPSVRGREIAAIVIGADGARIGYQAKTQIDPSEERDYVPGRGRRVFTVSGLPFGIAICHEAFRYPEISRSLARAGAQVIFVPHWVVTAGPLPTRWCDPANLDNDAALRQRATENTVFVAQANCAGTDQGSITGIVAPDGSLIASVPYGEVGLAVADVELALATRHLALRWAPERSLVETTTA